MWRPDDAVARASSVGTARRRDARVAAMTKRVISTVNQYLAEHPETSEHQIRVALMEAVYIFKEQHGS